MTLPALYELAAEYRADAEKLADFDLDEATLSDTLESLGGDLSTKAESMVMLARNLESTADAIGKAQAAMGERRKAIEHRAERLRAYVLACMTDNGIQKIECPAFVISVRKNPQSVEVLDERQIPAQYMRQPEPPPPAPDKKAIADALKAGADVPGCRLTQSIRLEIK